MTDDDFARLRAEFDQANEAGKELARGLRTFYIALVDEGFDRKEALALTTAYITALLTKPPGA